MNIQVASAMIEAKGLTKSHGAVQVLQGLDLSVKRGEVATIIGPSGGGKSTFLRCLNGLETFQGGVVTVDGLTIEPTTPEAARGKILRQVCRSVGMVFQNFNLFPHRTVLQNVVEAPIHVLRLSPEHAEARARILLDRVGLSDKVGAMPRQLSGGQQQRVAIARALAMEPKAILFDEPTSSLDPRMTAEVLDVMSGLAAEGLTMVVVTHAMHFARRVSNTIHVFDNGKVVESGSPTQIFEEPRHEATRKLLAETRAA